MHIFLSIFFFKNFDQSVFAPISCLSNEFLIDFKDQESRSEPQEEYMKELSFDPSIELFLKQILHTENKPSQPDNETNDETESSSFSGLDDFSVDSLVLDSDVENFVNSLLQNTTLPT